MKVFIVCLLALIPISFNSYSQQKIKGFYLSNLSEDGKKTWEVRGNEAIVSEKHIDIDKMNANYYIEDDIITATSDKAKLNKENMDVLLQKNVHIENKKGKTTITCEGTLEIERNKGKAVFNKDVVVTNEKGKLYSDKATVFFNTKEKQLIKVVSEGNVKIVRGDNIAYAKKATYFAKEEKIVLEGRPKLIYFTEGSEDMGLF